MENQSPSWGKFFVNIIKVIMLVFVFLVLISYLLLSAACNRLKTKYKYYDDPKTVVKESSLNMYIVNRLSEKYNNEFEIISMNSEDTSTCVNAISIDGSTGCLKWIKTGKKYNFIVEDKGGIRFNVTYKNAFYIENEDKKEYHEEYFSDDYKK